MLSLHQAQGDVPCHCILSLSAGLTSLVSSAVLTWSVLNVFYRSIRTPCKWSNGKRNRKHPQCVEQPLKHGSKEHVRKNPSTGKREWKIPQGSVDFAQGATDSSLIYSRTNSTWLHCNFINNQLQINFLCRLREWEFQACSFMNLL